MKISNISRYHTPTLAVPWPPPLRFAQACAAEPQATPAENATSQPPPGGTHDTTKPSAFNDLDTNKDGKLSRDEVVGDTQLSRDFDMIDTDKDGYITKGELKAYMRHRKDHWRGMGWLTRPAAFLWT